MSRMVEIAKESYDDMPSCDGGHYPYGTELMLENAVVEQLGLDSLAAGTKVRVTAMAFVVRKSEDAQEEGKDPEKRVALQLTEISTTKADERDRVEKLYPEGE